MPLLQQRACWSEESLWSWDCLQMYSTVVCEWRGLWRLRASFHSTLLQQATGKIWLSLLVASSIWVPARFKCNCEFFLAVCIFTLDVIPHHLFVTYPRWIVGDDLFFGGTFPPKKLPQTTNQLQLQVATAPMLWALLDLAVAHWLQQDQFWQFWLGAAGGWWLGAHPLAAAHFFWGAKMLRKPASNRSSVEQKGVLF